MIGIEKVGSIMEWKVIVTTPYWRLNGVNIFSEHLVRNLRERGCDAHILLTRPHAVNLNPMEMPVDIPFAKLSVTKTNSRKGRWRALIQYLEDRTPCIYIPNYDYEASSISPELSDRVAIVGILHSDDPEHYRHVRRLGKFWNAVVAVIREVAR
ncbi:MAG: hypothetical protein NC930_08055 [Candidatus Omnitrophica bacterium]|nr:hypothetical protein [Candidatus Omnitrophota bacterium]